MGQHVPFIDMHCDTLMQAWFRKRGQVGHAPYAMLDVERLKQGGASAQFFAIFLQSIRGKKYLGPFFPNDDVYIQQMMKIFYRTLQQYSDTIAFAGNYKDLKRNQENGKISAFLTIEDGRCMQGKPERLEYYYRQGVRLLTLTWNHQNCFGYPNSADPVMMKKGLSPFGRQAVEEMNRLGMLVDVSHLSDGGFRDVAQISKQPFVASHSNARALCNHPRNLTDDMIRTLAEHGGVIGLNHCPYFLYHDSHENRIEDLVAHASHIRNTGGIECLALGSDFDGISGKLAMKGPQDYGKLSYALHKAGFSDQDIDLIFEKNAQRVIRDVMR